MHVKLSVFFAQGPAGWSETWYFDFTGTLGDALSAIALKYAIKRTALLGQGAFIRALRVSDDEVRGDSRLLTFASEAEAPGEGVELPCGEPEDAYRVLIEAGTLHKRHVWLHGIPDDWITYKVGGTPNDPVPEMVKRFEALRKIWLGPPAWILKTANHGPGNPTVPINNATALDGRRVELDVPAIPMGLLAGDQVEVQGLTGSPGINSRHTVQFINAVTPVIRIFTPNAGREINTTPRARVRKYVPAYAEFDRVDLQVPTTHRVGRPFGAPRGRRPRAR